MTPTVQPSVSRLATRRMLASRLARFAVPIVCILAASCTSVGGKKVTVELATAPAIEADAYVLPQDRWFAGGKDLYRSFEKASDGAAKREALASLLEWLDAWRIRAKRTPVEVAIVACQHVFVAAHDGELEYVEFDPLELRADENGKRRITLEVASHGAGDETR